MTRRNRDDMEDPFDGLDSKREQKRPENEEEDDDDGKDKNNEPSSEEGDDDDGDDNGDENFIIRGGEGSEDDDDDDLLDAIGAAGSAEENGDSSQKKVVNNNKKNKNASEKVKKKQVKFEEGDGTTAGDVLKGGTDEDDDEDSDQHAAALLQAGGTHSAVNAQIWIAKLKLLCLLKKPNDTVVSIMSLPATDKAAKAALTELVSQIETSRATTEMYSAGMVTAAERKRDLLRGNNNNNKSTSVAPASVEEKPVQNQTRSELVAEMISAVMHESSNSAHALGGLTPPSAAALSQQPQQFLMVWADKVPTVPRDAATVQGPVSAADLNKWFRSGFFEKKAALILRLCRAEGSSKVGWQAAPRTRMEAQTGFVDE